MSSSEGRRARGERQAIEDSEVLTSRKATRYALEVFTELAREKKRPEVAMRCFVQLTKGTCFDPAKHFASLPAVLRASTEVRKYEDSDVRFGCTASSRIWDLFDNEALFRYFKPVQSGDRARFTHEIMASSLHGLLLPCMSLDASFYNLQVCRFVVKPSKLAQAWNFLIDCLESNNDLPSTYLENEIITRRSEDAPPPKKPLTFKGKPLKPSSAQQVIHLFRCVADSNRGLHPSQQKAAIDEARPLSKSGSEAVRSFSKRSHSSLSPRLQTHPALYIGRNDAHILPERENWAGGHAPSGVVARLEPNFLIEHAVIFRSREAGEDTTLINATIDGDLSLLGSIYACTGPIADAHKDRDAQSGWARCLGALQQCLTPIEIDELEKRSPQKKMTSGITQRAWAVPEAMCEAWIALQPPEALRLFPLTLEELNADRDWCNRYNQGKFLFDDAADLLEPLSSNGNRFGGLRQQIRNISERLDTVNEALRSKHNDLKHRFRLRLVAEAAFLERIYIAVAYFPSLKSVIDFLAPGAISSDAGMRNVNGRVEFHLPQSGEKCELTRTNVLASLSILASGLDILPPPTVVETQCHAETAREEVKSSQSIVEDRPEAGIATSNDKTITTAVLLAAKRRKFSDATALGTIYLGDNDHDGAVRKNAESYSDTSLPYNHRRVLNLAVLVAIENRIEPLIASILQECKEMDCFVADLESQHKKLASEASLIKSAINQLEGHQMGLQIQDTFQDMSTPESNEAPPAKVAENLDILFQEQHMLQENPLTTLVIYIVKSVRDHERILPPVFRRSYSQLFRRALCVKYDLGALICSLFNVLVAARKFSRCIFQKREKNVTDASVTQRNERLLHIRFALVLMSWLLIALIGALLLLLNPNQRSIKYLFKPSRWLRWVHDDADDDYYDGDNDNDIGKSTTNDRSKTMIPYTTKYFGRLPSSFTQRETLYDIDSTILDSLELSVVATVCALVIKAPLMTFLTWVADRFLSVPTKVQHKLRGTDGKDALSLDKRVFKWATQGPKIICRFICGVSFDRRYRNAALIRAKQRSEKKKRNIHRVSAVRGNFKDLANGGDFLSSTDASESSDDEGKEEKVLEKEKEFRRDNSKGLASEQNSSENAVVKLKSSVGASPLISQKKKKVRKKILKQKLAEALLSETGERARRLENRRVELVKQYAILRDNFGKIVHPHGNRKTAMAKYRNLDFVGRQPANSFGDIELGTSGTRIKSKEQSESESKYITPSHFTSLHYSNAAHHAWREAERWRLILDVFDASFKFKRNKTTGRMQPLFKHLKAKMMIELLDTTTLLDAVAPIRHISSHGNNRCWPEPSRAILVQQSISNQLEIIEKSMMRAKSILSIHVFDTDRSHSLVLSRRTHGREARNIVRDANARLWLQHIIDRLSVRAKRIFLQSAASWGKYDCDSDSSTEESQPFLLIEDAQPVSCIIKSICWAFFVLAGISTAAITYRLLLARANVIFNFSRCGFFASFLDNCNLDEDDEIKLEGKRATVFARFFVAAILIDHVVIQPLVVLMRFVTMPLFVAVEVSERHKDPSLPAIDYNLPKNIRPQPRMQPTQLETTRFGHDWIKTEKKVALAAFERQKNVHLSGSGPDSLLLDYAASAVASEPFPLAAAQRVALLDIMDATVSKSRSQADAMACKNTSTDARRTILKLKAYLQGQGLSSPTYEAPSIRFSDMKNDDFANLEIRGSTAVECQPGFVGRPPLRLSRMIVEATFLKKDDSRMVSTKSPAERLARIRNMARLKDKMPIMNSGAKDKGETQTRYASFLLKALVIPLSFLPIRGQDLVMTILSAILFGASALGSSRLVRGLSVWLIPVFRNSRRNLAQLSTLEALWISVALLLFFLVTLTFYWKRRRKWNGKESTLGKRNKELHIKTMRAN